jgi:hypothetical protein
MLEPKEKRTYCPGTHLFVAGHWGVNHLRSRQAGNVCDQWCRSSDSHLRDDVWGRECSSATHRRPEPASYGGLTPPT